MDMRCSAYPYTDVGKRAVSERIISGKNRSECITIAVCNQKCGVGKTITCANLGIGLAVPSRLQIPGEWNLNDSHIFRRVDVAYS
jgi:hypothetical protein